MQQCEITIIYSHFQYITEIYSHSHLFWQKFLESEGFTAETSLNKCLIWRNFFSWNYASRKQSLFYYSNFLRESKRTLKFSMPRCCLGFTKLLLKSSLAAIEGCWDMVGKEPEDVSELSSLAEPLALVDVLLASERKKM